MKNFLHIIFVILLIPVVWYILLPAEPPYQSHPQLTSPDADETREVFRFDWDTYEYIYKDQLSKGHRVHTNPNVFMPDQAVIIIEGTTPQNTIATPDYLIIDGKRYRYRTLPNGDIELQRSR